jgi:hypothetical protein
MKLPIFCSLVGDESSAVIPPPVLFNDEAKN